MPKSFDEFPIFFSEDDKMWLKGSPFLDQIDNRLDDIMFDYDLICEKVPEYNKFSFKDYSEARMIVSSRVFSFDINGVMTGGFVPYADMLNHN